MSSKEGERGLVEPDDETGGGRWNYQEDVTRVGRIEDDEGRGGRRRG